jgi:uncharacterized protein
MKWSKYNYLYRTDNAICYLYNSVSNSLLEIDSDTFNELSRLQAGQDFNHKNKKLCNMLQSAKAIVESDKDEYYNIKYRAQYHRFDNSFLQLTINPTLHCNFGCTYCFEGAKPPVYMDTKVEDAIIELIKRQKNIERIQITWFGGEPLMAFDSMVSLNHKIKELEIDYTADIVSNGYLLKERVIDELDNLKIKSIQITVDGLEETHNKRRPLVSGQGSFQQIIANMDLLRSKKPDFPLSIRVNLDVTNKDEFIEVCKFFYRRYKEHIYVGPGFVSDNDGCRTSDCLMNRDTIVDFMIELYKKHKFALNLYPHSRIAECSVRNPNVLVIGPKGEIYKCWNDVGNKKQVVGDLFGKRPVNNQLLLRYYTAGDPFEDNECRECFHLPICGGGCPYLRIRREYENKDIDTCYAKKEKLREFLELHCEFKQFIQTINKTQTLK